MNLLFDDIEVIESVGDPARVEVGGIAHDSRRVVPGDLFCCVPGSLSDGHAHALEAVERGAVGLLCEHFVPELLGRDVVQTRVAPGTMRPVMARLAGTFYGHPARDLLMIGVTGTNGKTTVTQLLGDLLGAAGVPTNVLGTLSGARTTPEAIEVQRILAGVRERQRSDGARHAVAMEVSSHALVQSRVEGIHFDVAVFTNLSHDHLDYHGTMEEYFEAKAMLFTPSYALHGVVNADDPWGRTLLERARIPAVPVRRDAANDIVLRPGHSEFTWRGQRVVTTLTGAVNVDNALWRRRPRWRSLSPGSARPRSRRPWPPSPRSRAACRSWLPRPPAERRPVGEGWPPGRPSPSWSTTPTRRPAWRWSSARHIGWPAGTAA